MLGMYSTRPWTNLSVGSYCSGWFCRLLALPYRILFNNFCCAAAFLRVMLPGGAIKLDWYGFCAEPSLLPELRWEEVAASGFPLGVVERSCSDRPRPGICASICPMHVIAIRLTYLNWLCSFVYGALSTTFRSSVVMLV